MVVRRVRIMDDAINAEKIEDASTYQKVVKTDCSAGANNFSWPRTFEGTPTTVATVVTTSTGAIGCNVSEVTTTGGTVNVSESSTVNIVGIYVP